MKPTYTYTLIALAIVALGAWYFLQPPVMPIVTPTPETPVVIEPVEPLVITAEMPESFKGVEMTTYRSEKAGYEITYPKSWKVIPTPEEALDEGRIENYAIYPEIIPYGPDPIINIYADQETLEQVLSRRGEDTSDLIKIVLNGIIGYKEPLDTRGMLYFFEKAGILYYLVFINYPDYNVSDAEAQWVLSTFKILQQ
jgi:hypothetical protein